MDRFILTSAKLGPVWQVKEDVRCIDCGKIARGYRLVRSEHYDKTTAPPEFRCESCSMKKAEELKKKGVHTE